jgi:hypothetical protein
LRRNPRDYFAADQVSEDISRLIDINVKEALDRSVIYRAIVAHMLYDLSVDLVNRTAMIKNGRS